MADLFAIDPGSLESAFVEYSSGEIVGFGKIPNHDILTILGQLAPGWVVVVEQIVSYGMPVGTEIFETVFWSGRFAETCEKRGIPWDRIPRHVVKLHLCHTVRAKDGNIVAALVDRYDPNREFGKYGKGTKKRKGPFFGFFADVWQAAALAVTYAEIRGGII